MMQLLQLQWKNLLERQQLTSLFTKVNINVENNQNCALQSRHRPSRWYIIYQYFIPMYTWGHNVGRPKHAQSFQGGKIITTVVPNISPRTRYHVSNPPTYSTIVLHSSFCVAVKFSIHVSPSPEATMVVDQGMLKVPKMVKSISLDVQCQWMPAVKFYAFQLHRKIVKQWLLPL